MASLFNFFEQENPYLKGVKKRTPLVKHNNINSIEESKVLQFWLVILLVITQVVGLLSKGLIPSAFALNRALVMKGEVWRLIGYGFFHLNWFHLIENSLCIIWFVPHIERFFGIKKSLIILLGSTLFGGIFSCAMQSSMLTIGASGACFGVIGAMAGAVKYVRKEDYSAASNLKRVSFVFILVSAIVALIPLNIDIFTHIGGFIGGFILAKALGLRDETEYKGLRKAWTVVFMAATIFLSGIMCFRPLNLEWHGFLTITNSIIKTVVEETDLFGDINFDEAYPSYGPITGTK